MISEFLSLATIPELIEFMKKQDTTHSKLHFKSSFDTSSGMLMINSGSILERYMDFITANSTTVAFSAEDFRKYRFQPKKLSLVLYQTTELWSLLLKINNMTSILDFKKRSLLIPPASIIFNLLNEIIILEQKQIEANTLAQQ